MKRVIASVIILVVLIGASVGGIFYLKYVSEEMLTLTSGALESVDRQDIKKAGELTDKLSGLWDRHHRILSLYVRHNDVDEISKYLSELEQLLKHGDTSEFASRISHIEYLIHHLWESEIPTIPNVL